MVGHPTFRAGAEFDQFNGLVKMVRNLLAGALTRQFGFLDQSGEVVPTRVVQQRCQLACEPEFRPIVVQQLDPFKCLVVVVGRYASHVAPRYRKFAEQTI